MYVCWQLLLEVLCECLDEAKVHSKVAALNRPEVASKFILDLLTEASQNAQKSDEESDLYKVFLKPKRWLGI